MSDNWEVGDLALCINDTAPVSGKLGGDSLRLGAVYDVEGVTAPAPWTNGWFGVGLILKQSKSLLLEGDWPADRFIKVTPDASDEFDRETIALLNGKPVPVPA